MTCAYNAFVSFPALVTASGLRDDDSVKHLYSNVLQRSSGPVVLCIVSEKSQHTEINCILHVKIMEASMIHCFFLVY